MTAPELPPDLAALSAELERLAEEFVHLAEPLDENAFNWQPAGGRAWSIGQCIDHLARANRLYLDELEAAARRARERARTRRGPLRPNRLGRWFAGLLEPPPRFRFRAGGQLAPESRCPKAETLERFAAKQRRAIALTRELAEIDANGTRFRNPLAGKLPLFNLAAGADILAAHERRHLWQAQRVREQPEFPR